MFDLQTLSKLRKMICPDPDEIEEYVKEEEEEKDDDDDHSDEDQSEVSPGQV